MESRPPAVPLALLFFFAGPVLTLGTALQAQSTSLVFAVDPRVTTLDGANGNVLLATIEEVELGVVTPEPGVAYSAQAFLTSVAVWAHLGDEDADGEFHEPDYDDGEIDAVFVRRYPAAALDVGPRDVFVSREGSGYGAAWRGDVVRYSSQGAVETFVSSGQLAVATFGGIALNLDALCQDAAGNLYFSVATSIAGNYLPEQIVTIPRAAITYDPVTNNVVSFFPGSAIPISTGADQVGWIANAGVVGSPTSAANLTALEIDPAGGTWTSSVTGQAYPNLLFSWILGGSGGAIVSTANGGSLATINGVPMGAPGVPVGAHLGVQPGPFGTGSVRGLALIPESRPFVLESSPENRIPINGVPATRQEVVGATPGGLLAFFFDPQQSAPGTIIPEVPLPSLFRGRLLGDGVVQLNGFVVADTDGFAARLTTIPAFVFGTNAFVSLQVYDVSARAFSTPATLDFD